MQLLLLTAGDQSYALEAQTVVEVLPMVPARPIPHLPDYVIGMVAYRGRLIPVVDLVRRLTGVFAKRRLSTRMIVVEFVPENAAGAATQAGKVRMGLLAENMVSMGRAEDTVTVFSGMHLENAPYLGRIIRLDGRTVHVLNVGNLLPKELAAGLFASGAEPQVP
jgi:chemotaxis-related protein WspB